MKIKLYTAVVVLVLLPAPAAAVAYLAPANAASGAPETASFTTIAPAPVGVKALIDP